mgnify:FL=1
MAGAASVGEPAVDLGGVEPQPELGAEQIERRQRTIVDYLINQVLGPADRNWRDFITSGVSDVDEAQSIYLMPSHMELALFEREVSTQKREVQLRGAIRAFLQEARQMFDIIIVDCPPGLSLITECWLRECDYLLPPTKPDYLGVRGFSILKRFLEQYADQGFAKLLGVLVNLKDDRSALEDEWHRRLAEDPANRCFESFVPRRAYVQRAADFAPQKRTYIAKYPGDAGQCMRNLTQEVLMRIAGDSIATGADAAPAQAMPMPPPQAEATRVAALQSMPRPAPGMVAAPASVATPIPVAVPVIASPPLPTSPSPPRSPMPTLVPAAAAPTPSPQPQIKLAPEDDDEEEVVLSLPQPSERVTGFLAGAAAKDTRPGAPTPQPAPVAPPAPMLADLPSLRAPVWGSRPAMAQTLRVPRVYAIPDPTAPKADEPSQQDVSAKSAAAEDIKKA